MPKRRPNSAPSRTRRPIGRSLFAVAGMLVLLIAGCGGSSSNSSTAAAGSGIASATGPGGERLGQYRACLQGHGVTFPNRPPGTRPPGAGGGGGLFGGSGGRGLRNNPKFAAAAKACGLPAGGFGPRRRFQAPQVKAALNTWVACVRKHGYNLPAPNTSGNGPVFDPTKVNQRDPKFIAAARACQADLQALRGPAGAGPPGAAGP